MFVKTSLQTIFDRNRTKIEPSERLKHTHARLLRDGLFSFQINYYKTN